MNNVSDIKDCFGCGVCATVCPKDVITITLNKSGFYEPIVDENRCIDCAACRKVCSFINSGLALLSPEISGYAAWSNDETIRMKASSGGIGFEIAKYLIGLGYTACGVRYNIEEKQAEHYLTDDVEAYKASIGSKYIQSYTKTAFRNINLKGKTLVVGTPCQIDSFRRYIKLKRKEDNFVLMDFFCHGVPSMWMWYNYLKINEAKTGELKDVTWRNKKTGWHDSWAMHLQGEKGTIYSLRSQGDLFYRLFLGDWCMNPACVKNCKFKYKLSSADIRIGDLWGETYNKNKEGVSAAIAFTSKGKKILESLSDCTLIPHAFKVVAEGQMRKNAKNAILYPLVKVMLNTRKMYSIRTWNLLAKLELALYVPKIIMNKLKRGVIK